jgi:FkbM family methyltransferase
MRADMLKKIIRSTIPPFIYDFASFVKNSRNNNSKPEWHVIKNGDLQGRKIYADSSLRTWQADMVNGVYDKFLFEYIHNYDLKGKTVLDIGAHIGYHTMVFSSLVGGNGFVYAFEPNLSNAERLRSNLAENADLNSRVKILNLAVSDVEEEIDFYYSDNVDGGRSSGSFISKAHTYYPKTDDMLNNHKVTRVKTIRIDKLDDYLGVSVVPVLIKIDVEGAECCVLAGAKKMLKEHRPIIIIEVHSIYNMFIVSNILRECNYEQTLLKEELDGRCFIAAKPIK